MDGADSVDRRLDRFHILPVQEALGILAQKTPLLLQAQSNIGQIQPLLAQHILGIGDADGVKSVQLDGQGIPVFLLECLSLGRRSSQQTARVAQKIVQGLQNMAVKQRRISGEMVGHVDDLAADLGQQPGVERLFIRRKARGQGFVLGQHGFCQPISVQPMLDQRAHIGFSRRNRLAHGQHNGGASAIVKLAALLFPHGSHASHNLLGQLIQLL